MERREYSDRSGISTAKSEFVWGDVTERASGAVLGRFAPGDNEKVLFGSTPTFRAKHALRVARGNAGKFSFEFISPTKAYLELFERLASIEGLVEVVDLDRYSLGMEAGGLFNVVDVARELVSVIQQTFYPEEEIEWGRRFVVSAGEELLVEPAEATESSVATDSPSVSASKSRTVIGE
jgi:hypothetical protein